MMDEQTKLELVADLAHYVVEQEFSAICSLYKQTENGDLVYVDAVQDAFNKHYDAIEDIVMYLASEKKD